MMFAAQEGLKDFGEGQKDSTALKVPPLYTANPGLISGSVYGPLNSIRSGP